MILTRFTGALAALGAWCVLATVGAAPTFELPGIPAQAKDSVGALFQAIAGGPASMPGATDEVRARIGKGGVQLGMQLNEPRQRGFDSVFPQP